MSVPSAIQRFFLPLTIGELNNIKKIFQLEIGAKSLENMLDKSTGAI